MVFKAAQLTKIGRLIAISIAVMLGKEIASQVKGSDER